MYSAILKRAYIWGTAWAVSIEPLNICNLQCPECPTGMRMLSRHKGMLTVGTYRTMLGNLGKAVWHINLYFQGEPYMHPDFFTLVEQAKKARLIVETSTNGQFLSYPKALRTVQSGLDVLVVSFDGITQSAYEKYRIGGELSKVTNGIINLVKAKKEVGSDKPIIRAQFLAFRHNQHQIKEFEGMAWALGADMVEVKKAQFYNVQRKKHMLPTETGLSRYRINNDGSVDIKGKFKNKCWKHWSSAVATWEGDLVPCCFDKDATYIMGNIQEKTIGELWKAHGYNEFRQKVISNQHNIDICNNCPLSRK
ncbi:MULTISPECIES: radical SAM/SPASM domain-containing protein [unclassified Saccharicrinis]|uniref:radical SAM/SPASM domain-containing protein n=1 Tax=unclassified Saccharicrinis TaxID=2646859 RepID=UPI003D34320F